MNKYLEKVAEFTKTSWDTDYEEGGGLFSSKEYGIQANRSMGPKHKVWDSLESAVNDPHTNVGIQSMSQKKYKETSSWKDGQDAVRAHIKELRNEVDPNKKDLWDRSDSWSMGMKLDNPILKEYPSEYDPKSRHASVHTYLHKKHNV